MADIETKVGVVIAITDTRPGITELVVDVAGEKRNAAAYQSIVKYISVGDRVILNTTANSLQLGSGGWDFVIANLDRMQPDLTGHGHIMKMRYTPLQCRVLSVEEPDNPNHDLFTSTDSLDGTPVMVGTLHSMLAPLCACLALHNLKVVYVMTDGASLPLAWSKTVSMLKEKQLLTGTVTIGNAWGGDLEAVNVFSGLLAAKAVFKPDVIIVTMGPGIVGTGTKWGFSGIEQGVILNAVESLKGKPVAIPRISFADSRLRHQGISHHTVTVLTRVCHVRTCLSLPVLTGDKAEVLRQQIELHRIGDKHEIVFWDGTIVEDGLKYYGLDVTTMGRNVEEDRDFFLALGASARGVLELLNPKN